MTTPPTNPSPDGTLEWMREVVSEIEVTGLNCPHGSSNPHDYEKWHDTIFDILRRAYAVQHEASKAMRDYLDGLSTHWPELSNEPWVTRIKALVNAYDASPRRDGGKEKRL